MTDELEKLQRKHGKSIPASIECQSEIDKDLVRAYYGDLGAFYRVRAALAATPAGLNQDAADQPAFDNPRDPFASPDRVAATPAVGGEGLNKAIIRLREYAGVLDSDAFADINEPNLREDIDMVCSAAQPTSPLRGREALKHIEPPFGVYHNLTEIGDKNGHVCTAENPDIAKDIVTALNLASPPKQPAAAPFQPHENCNCLMCLAEKPRDEP